MNDDDWAIVIGQRISDRRSEAQRERLARAVGRGTNAGLSHGTAASHGTAGNSGTIASPASGLAAPHRDGAANLPATGRIGLGRLRLLGSRNP